jgi:hypothetical protein
VPRAEAPTLTFSLKTGRRGLCQQRQEGARPRQRRVGTHQ